MIPLAFPLFDQSLFGLILSVSVNQPKVCHSYFESYVGMDDSLGGLSLISEGYIPLEDWFGFY